MIKLGIAYSVSGNYIMKTLPSLISILENNKNCADNERVDLSIFFYVTDIEEKSVAELQGRCNYYDVPIQIFDSRRFIDILKKAGASEYQGSLLIDLHMVVPETMDVSYNVLFLQSDVVMNHGNSLYDLAAYDFDGGKRSCASTIDTQSCPMIKKVVPLAENEHVFNDGVFLVSPRLYKEHHVYDKYVCSMKERGWKLYPYWNMLRNAYALRDELCILPMRYQVYPGQKMLDISQWFRIFGLREEEYYSKEEISTALASPVFVHYINFIVKKPWMNDTIKNYDKKEGWPYQNIWWHYAELTGITQDISEEWNKTFFEKFKRFFYMHIRWAYVLMCTVAYKYDSKMRNRIIEKLADEEYKDE